MLEESRAMCTSTGKSTADIALCVAVRRTIESIDDFMSSLRRFFFMKKITITSMHANAGSVEVNIYTWWIGVKIDARLCDWHPSNVRRIMNKADKIAV